MLLSIKFEGNLAEEHRIPAYAGIQSLQGHTRAVLIVSNYLVEGRVRRRRFDEVPINFNLVAQQPGSFDSLFELSWGFAAIGGTLAIGVAGNLITDLLKVIYRRVCGIPEGETAAAYQELQREKPGDIEALIDAVEPSVRLGHNVINHGVININIK